MILPPSFNESINTSATTSVRRKKNECLSERICDKKKNYRRCFNSLNKRCSKERSNDMACSIIAACIDNGSPVDVSNNILHNKELLQHCHDFIESIKFEVQSIIHVPFSSLTHGNGQDREEHDNRSDAHTKTVVNMLTGLSRNEYDRQRKDLLTDFPHINKKDIPTYYEVNKHIPPFEEIVLDVNHQDDSQHELVDSHELRNSSIEDTSIDPFLRIIPVNPTPTYNEQGGEAATTHSYPTASSVIGREEDMTLDEALQLLRAKQVEQSNTTFTRLVGGMKTYVNILYEKFGRLGIPMNDSLLVIDSYDGAEHRKFRGRNTGVVSFSSTLCCESSIKNGYTTSQSHNMLTHHQYVGNETIKTLFPVVTGIYKDKESIRSNDGKIDGIEDKTFDFYDLHDGKMLYLLTQHSLYSRKHYPFLLCKCHRGQGVKDEQHQCHFISEQEQINYYERSKRRFENKRNRLKMNETYDKGDHMDWIDVNNFGISHFGIHPKLLPRDKILFDTLHCRMSITRRLLNYTRNFMNKCFISIEMQKEFCDLLSECWTDHNCLSWIMGGSFQRLVGSELFSFVNIVDKVTAFMKEKILPSDILDSICNALLLWKEICPLLTITSYENEAKFDEKYNLLNVKVKEVYNAGTKTFLTKDPSDIGNDETFYLHVLRFYLPQIMKRLYYKHKVGLGICNMQGFERRNKESKNTMRRFFNGKGNIILTNMKRLWKVFYYSKNGY